MSRMAFAASTAMLFTFYGQARVAYCERNLPREPGTVSGGYLRSDLQSLVTTSHTNGMQFTIKNIGHSTNGRAILSVTAEFRQHIEKIHTVLFICRQHGHEPASTSGALMFLGDLATEPEDSELFHEMKDVRVVVVPVANPDGAAAFLRHNAKNVDLNRDWLKRKEPETKALWHLILETRPDIVVDQHELYPNDTRSDFTETAALGSGISPELAHRCALLQNSVDQRMAHQGFPVTEHWITDHHPARLAHRYASVVLHIPSILFETNRNEHIVRPLQVRANVHRTFMEAVVRYASGSGSALDAVQDRTSNLTLPVQRTKL